MLSDGLADIRCKKEKLSLLASIFLLSISFSDMSHGGVAMGRLMRAAAGAEAIVSPASLDGPSAQRRRSGGGQLARPDGLDCPR